MAKTPTAPVVANEAPDPAKAIVTLKAGALSRDVGLKVLSALAKADTDKAKAETMIIESTQKRRDALAMMTLALAKAAQADETINLAAVFRDDSKAKDLLFRQCRIALGIEEYRQVGKGDKQVMKCVLTKECEKFFPIKGKDNKDTEEGRAKETFRANFTAQLRKAIGAASGLNERGIKAKEDKETGTLLISGPEVEKTFGKSEVLLNEKLKDGETTLKVKPSFTELSRIGERAAGINKPRPPGTPSTPSPVAVDPDTAVVSQCNVLTGTINKLGDLTAKQREALESLASVIATKLKAKKAA